MRVLITFIVCLLAIPLYADTVGTTGTGGSNSAISVDDKAASIWRSGRAGSAATIFIRAANNFNGDDTVIGFFYEDSSIDGGSDTTPGALVGQTTDSIFFTSGTPSWQSASISGTILKNSLYWIGFANGGNSSCAWDYLELGSGNERYIVADALPIADPWGTPGAAFTNRFSAYIVYTADACSSPDTTGTAQSAGDASTLATTGSFSTTAVFFTMGDTNSTQHYGGLWFDNPCIDSGATIDSAFLRVISANLENGTGARTKITGEDTASATSWSSDDFSSRTKTTAAVDWDPDVAWSDGDTIHSPNIASVVQEVIDRSDYVEGNPIMILIDNDASTANNFKTFDTRDATAGVDNEPKLIVYWSVAGEAGTIRRRKVILGAGG